MSVLLLLIILFTVSGCGKISHSQDASGSVVYRCNGIEFEEALTPEEVAAVVGVLNGKRAGWEILSGTPSCGFDPEVAIIIDGTRYALAMDQCGSLQNCNTLQYISISDAERAILEEIFTSRGGKFPCI